MKKITTFVFLLLLTLSASAQFEKGKVMINTSLTGLDLSYSNGDKGHFGIEGAGGYFIADNLALTANIGMDLTDNLNKYTFGIGGRYYFDNGIYLGGQVRTSTYKPKNASEDNDFSLYGEAGYAFFLSHTITIEPGIYLNQSLSKNDYTRFGLKVGFSFYF